MKRLAIAVSLTLGLIAAAPALAAAGVSWLHIHVNDNGPDPENVRVNVPVSVIDAVLPEFEKHTRHENEFDIGNCEMTVAEYRQSIRTLSSSPRREIKMDRARGTIVMRRDGPNLILVQTPKNGNTSKTHVRMPWNVATALAKGTGKTLDVTGAMRALAQAGQGEIAVDDEDGSRVRIWIDEVAFPSEADA